MDMRKILEAADGTLALARSRGMEYCQWGHDPVEYAHLVEMRERMNEPDFSIGKANRWLGYMQGVVIGFSVGSDEGPIPLDDIKNLNRPAEG